MGEVGAGEHREQATLESWSGIMLYGPTDCE